ncbi:MAG TPA: hypothetical protein VF666_05795 [Pyrinomonadaceae bacterium]|jgi:hypothetical protein
MKMKLWAKRSLAFALGAMTMGFLSFIVTSNAQNPFVKLIMRFGEERVLEDGTKVGVSKGDGDLIIVTLSRPASNQASGLNQSDANQTLRPTSNQSFQRNDFLGTWECYEVPDEYQSGSGRIPSSLRPAFLVKYHSNAVTQSAAPEDRQFTSPMNTINWKYTAQSDTSGVIVLTDSFGMVAARLRVKWIDINTHEDVILYSNEPAYIGIRRVFKRIRS